MTRLIRFNKPFDVLAQFTDRGNAGTPRRTLSDFIDLPGVYPAGRLDRDSEGLMLLTDDGRLQARISDPRHKMEKAYWVQVEGLPDEAEPAPRTGPEPDEEPLEAVREEDLVPPTGAGVQVQGIAEDMPRLDLQRGPRRSETGARSPLVPKDRRRSPLFWVVLVAALGTAAFTGYNLYRHPEAFTFLSSQKIRDLWRRHQVEARLAVENLEGFYRDLPGGRRVFVIRGEVLNRSGIPQSLIRVKGNLFDARGRTMASREVFCGNVLGDRDLATLPAEAIDARLQNEVGNALQNMDIAPGGRVPFMVVFLPAPEGVTTYNVEVTEAREGASGG